MTEVVILLADPCAHGLKALVSYPASLGLRLHSKSKNWAEKHQFLKLDAAELCREEDEPTSIQP